MDKATYDKYRETYRDETKLRYTCSFCGKKFHTRAMSDDCCLDEMLLVPVYKADMPLLIQFLYTGNNTILPKRLVETILRYNRLHGETK